MLELLRVVNDTEEADAETTNASYSLNEAIWPPKTHRCGHPRTIFFLSIFQVYQISVLTLHILPFYFFPLSSG